MYVYQLSTGYFKQFATSTRINVIDESEDEIAAVAVGKDLNTGEWCASMYFCDPMEHKDFRHEC